MSAKRAKKIMIAMATPEFVIPECYESVIYMMLAFKAKYPDVKLAYAKASGVRTDQNRNLMLKRFLDEDYGDEDAILHLDADMTYPSDMLIKYYEHNKEAMGCLYFKRRAPFEPILYNIVKETTHRPFEVIDPRNIDKNALINVDAVGTGGLWTKKKAVKKLGDDPWFYYGKNFYLPFEADYKQGHDIWYCKRLRDVGVKIFVDMSIRPKHIGKQEIDESTWLDYIAKHPEEDIRKEIKKCTLIFPTAHRADQVKKMLQVIVGRTAYPYYNIYVIAEGKDTIKVLENAKEKGCPVDWIEVDEYQGYAKSINMGIEANPDSFYFVYMADDVMPGSKWLETAISFMEDFFPQKDGLICFNDGKWNGEHACHGLVSRNTWKNMGNSTLFFEGYKHYHPDRELTLTTQARNKYGYCPSSVLWHNQSRIGLSKADEITKKALSTVKEDTKLFNERKAKGFPSF